MIIIFGDNYQLKIQTLNNYEAYYYLVTYKLHHKNYQTTSIILNNYTFDLFIKFSYTIIKHTKNIYIYCI